MPCIKRIETLLLQHLGMYIKYNLLYLYTFKGIETSYLEILETSLRLLTELAFFLVIENKKTIIRHFPPLF